jgi:hypothetical protein
MEIRRVRATRWDTPDRPGAKADGSIEDCLAGQALVWSTGSVGVKKVLLYYDTNLGVSWSPAAPMAGGKSASVR